MKTLLIVLSISLFATTAFADVPPEKSPPADTEAKRKEAQEKLDAAKVKACEGTKKYLNAQKACADDAAAANKITCTPVTSKDMQALNVKCSERLTASAKETTEKAKATSEKMKADAVDKDLCKALGEDGAQLFEARDASLVACKDKLKAELTKSKCTDGVKKVKYQFQRGTGKPSPATVYCGK